MAILLSHSALSLLPFLALILSFYLSNCEPFIGVNYGQVADNLPPPSATAKLLQSTAIEKVRLYGTDPAIIKALANTGKGIVIGAANGDVPSLASDPNFAKNWVSSNVLAYYPASNIILITVGNEVITSPDQNLMNQLIPAVQNVQNALDAASLGGKVKVSTVHSMAVLSASEPPSAGKFHPEYNTVLQGLLSFNNATGSPFAINPYPFFAFRDDPGRAENLAFCLFQPNSGRVDSNSNLKYMNMFDAQVDAVRSALDSLGFKNVEIVVAETGWPYKGDSNEVGVSLENAKAYNSGLVAHLRSMVGTPLMPGKSVDTYLFALYDEDLKPGAASERAFGLFNPDQSMIYDAGLLLTQQPSNTTSPVVAPTPEVSKSPETTPVVSQPPEAATNVSKSPVIPVQTGPSATPNKAEHLYGNETTPDVSRSPVTPKPTVTSPTSPKPNNAAWCVPKAGVTNVNLQVNLDYACAQGIDCSPIQPGGTCFEPNTLLNHAAFAMNLYYQTAGRNPLSCDFLQTAMLSTTNPSYNSCVYAGGNA